MRSLLWLLFYEFFKIGLFAVGGGPATIPYLMDLAEKYDWFTMQDVTNMIAISESTPGPLGLNMATYVGNDAMSSFGALWSVLGGAWASIALTIPSIIVIVLIAKFLDNFSQNRWVKAAFYTIRPAVAGLIAAAVCNVFEVTVLVEEAGKKTLAVETFIVFLVVFLLMFNKKLSKLHPALWFLAAAVIGCVFRL